MTRPTNREEYLARFAANQSYEGFGVDTTAVFPCPFCAAPRWAVVKIIEAEQRLSKPHHCGECRRSSKAIFDRSNGLRFEFVQTGGPDQPEWLEPKMRRVDD